MPYIFPKRRLRDEDVLDSVEMNEDFISSADLYSGNIDEHNLKSSLDPAIAMNVAPSTSETMSPILSNAYWNIYYVRKELTAGARWGVPDSYTNPEVNEALGAFAIQNSPSWQAVADTKVVLATGHSKLWITACLQYVWSGFDQDGGHLFSSPPSEADEIFDDGKTYARMGAWGKYPCMIQFALRIDGQIIENTVTGLDYPHDKVVKPYKSRQERTRGLKVQIENGPPNAVTPGPAMDGEPNCGALASEVNGVRLGAQIPVSAGTHTVEVVARRLDIFGVDNPEPEDPPEDHPFLPSDKISYSAGNKVGVINRQMLVVDYPLLAPATAPAEGISVKNYEAEDAFSAQSIGPDRLNPIRDKFNDIQPGALARGALNNNHLESKVRLASMGTILPTDESSFTTYYPGYQPTYPLAANFTGLSRTGEGWYGPLEDASTAASGQLSATINQTIDATTVFVVLGNVECFRINKYKPQSNFESSGNEFAAFNIGYDQTPPGGAAAKVAFGQSEIVCNRDQNMGVSFAPTGSLDEGYLDPIAHDIAMMHVFIVDTGAQVDNTSTARDSNNGILYGFPLGTSFQEIGIYGSSMAPEEFKTISDDPADTTIVCPSAGPISGVTVPVVYYRGNVVVLGFKKS